MVSMTGYAWREKNENGVSVSVELKGYNNRFLEIYVNLPNWLFALEPEIRERIGAICGRGKVEIMIRVREQNAPLCVTLNIGTAKEYMKAVSAIAEATGINETLSISSLIAMDGVIEVEKNRDDGRYWNLIEPVLADALGAFNDERIREGKHTEHDILDLIGIMEGELETVVLHASAIENSIRENIKNRFKELLGDKIDENRVLAETAVLLMKYTIAEEISRLSSHFAEFRAETAKNPRPGKKLDFLSQEINREINTIGSKSSILEVSSAVVKMKEALENIREQLRNVE
jgi:uncharacterized protein (TIGR00255 family)